MSNLADTTEQDLYDADYSNTVKNQWIKKEIDQDFFLSWGQGLM